MAVSMPMCSDAPIWSVWMSAFHLPTLVVAHELELFAALRDRAASAADLAATMKLELRATEAMCGVLVSLGFLSQGGGRFRLTDAARTYLLPESPYYWGGMLRRMRDNPIDCRKLVEGLRRGGGRINELWKAPSPPPPEVLVAFTEAMHSHSFALAMRVIPDFPLRGVHRVLDVGGGSGSYVIAAMLHHRELRCTVLDLPPVCEVARGYAERHGVGERLSLAAADMFREPFPTGHDRVLMCDVFHDWDDERCAALARQAHAALPPGGRIWLHEMLLDDSKLGPADATAYSMIMVFGTEGRQRTASELAGILTGAGFADVNVTMTSAGFALIEATRT